jgi:hydrogenase nickel incorporation protein HypA/HybF
MIHEQVLEVLEKHEGKGVKRVKLKIGEFSLIQVDQLNFCLKILTEDDKRFNSGKIYEYNEEKGRISCFSCDYEGLPLHIEQNPLIKEVGFTMAYTCPSCKSNDTQIILGNDMVIETIELLM